MNELSQKKLLNEGFRDAIRTVGRQAANFISPTAVSEYDGVKQGVNNIKSAFTKPRSGAQFIKNFAKQNPERFKGGNITVTSDIEKDGIADVNWTAEVDIHSTGNFDGGTISAMTRLKKVNTEEMYEIIGVFEPTDTSGNDLPGDETTSEESEEFINESAQQIRALKTGEMMNYSERLSVLFSGGKTEEEKAEKNTGKPTSVDKFVDYSREMQEPQWFENVTSDNFIVKYREWQKGSDTVGAGMKRNQQKIAKNDSTFDIIFVKQYLKEFIEANNLKTRPDRILKGAKIESTTSLSNRDMKSIASTMTAKGILKESMKNTLVNFYS